jgi:hypothetical protein
LDPGIALRADKRSSGTKVGVFCSKAFAIARNTAKNTGMSRNSNFRDGFDYNLRGIDDQPTIDRRSTWTSHREELKY